MSSLEARAVLPRFEYLTQALFSCRQPGLEPGVSTTAFIYAPRDSDPEGPFAFPCSGQDHRAASGCSQGDGTHSQEGFADCPAGVKSCPLAVSPLGLPLPPRDHPQSGPPRRAASSPYHLLCAVPFPSLSWSSLQNPRPQLWSPKSTGQGWTTTSLLPASLGWDTECSGQAALVQILSNSSLAFCLLLSPLRCPDIPTSNILVPSFVR